MRPYSPVVAPGPRLLAALLLVAGCRDARFAITPLSSPAVGQSADPALVVLPESGELVMSWIGGDGRAWSLQAARSADGGRTWSAPVVVAGNGQGGDEIHPHGESSPRLVAGPGRLLAVTWVSSFKVEGRKWPATRMRVARSTDGGTTWSGPVTLNDDSAGAPVSHQFHGAAWQSDSALVVAWLDERHVPDQAPGAGADGGEPDATLYTAASPDFGLSWAANSRLWGAVCPCCRVTLARLGDGSVAAAWRRHFPGSVRDVVLAPLSRSAEPKAVHADGWVYPGCPHTGPAAVSSGGWTHVAWYSGKEGAKGVFYRHVRGGERHQAGPLVPVFTGDRVSTAHPAVVALPDGGALVAADVVDGGQRVIRLAGVGPSGDRAAAVTVPGSAGGQYPQLVRLSGGELVLAYAVSEGEARRVHAAVVRLPTAR